jgi:hypothetical protein
LQGCWWKEKLEEYELSVRKDFKTINTQRNGGREREGPAVGSTARSNFGREFGKESVPCGELFY